MRRTPEERIENNILLIPESTCHWWVGALTGNGYGRIAINGKVTRAHRLIYEMHQGEIPEGMQVCHSCDNPLCVNISHLWLGTALDNCRDMHSKGRNKVPFGSAHTRAKITESDVVEIRELAGKLTHSKIADIYGIAHQTVGFIISRKTWAHVV